MPHPFATTPELDLTSFDVILVNSSAGKDSQAMLDYLVEQADAQGVSRDRLVVVHADLGRVEWAGTKALAEEQARHYGLRFEVVSKKTLDLLEQVEARRRWPDKANRYCTSDQKRDPIATVITALAKEVRQRTGRRQARILNCLGLRAQESDARRVCPDCKGKAPEQATCRRCLGTGNHPTLEANSRQCNSVKQVTDHLPIHAWTLDQVWARIKASGVRSHEAYALGMSRLSCVFCVFASKPDLLIAGQHNPALLDTYCGVEERIGHQFTAKLSIRSIRLQLVTTATTAA